VSTTVHHLLFNSSTTRNNFKWFCDNCLTKHEESQVSTLGTRFTELVDQVSLMAAELSNVKDALTVQPNIPVSSSTSANVWNDTARVQHVRSSLVLKSSSDGQSSGLDAAKLKQLKDIAVKNKIPVSNIGTSKNGNTFIHCPSAADRDRLNTTVFSLTLLVFRTRKLYL